MKNINKLTSTYTYPAKGKGQPAIEVGFFLDVRKDRYGNALRKVNVLDQYGQIHPVDYCGFTLMLSVQTGLRTTSVRRAKREDLSKYKDAYESYLSGLTLEEKEFHLANIYSLLTEFAPKPSEKEIAAKQEKENALKEAEAEIERLKAELAKKAKKKASKEESESDKSNNESTTE